MGKIRRLSPELADQIAAGEVVERPASLVKELIENALDAGARHVAVTIEFGGKKLVRVEDDGDGMEAEDARLALERHATSKIARVDDLAAIATLGFRGEALPSIASVSHLRLRTRPRTAMAGTEIRVNGGAVASVVEAAAPEGTMVEVSDLFYNMPARRRFLKSDAAEAAQVSRLVTQLALGYPEVGFSLTSARRRVLECPPVSNLDERLYQIYGDRPDLVEVNKEAAGLRIWGRVAALADHGPTRGPQNIFVNRRIVKDRTIAHAIIEAYSVATIRERSPEVHLFLELSPAAVDVNVHPTKAEVRFKEQSLVHEVMRRALGDALGRAPSPPFELRQPPESSPSVPPVSFPGLMGGVSAAGWTPSGPPPDFVERPGRSSAGDGGGAAGMEPPLSAPQGGERGELVPGEFIHNELIIKPMLPLGQFRDTFIIAVDDEGLAIVDQHVAHERVLFERVMERLTAGRLESQRLLEPLLIDLSPAGRQALLARAADLERFGFELEEFGGAVVRVTAVPALLGPEAIATALRALAEDLEGLDRHAPIEDALRRIAATMACHAAVKAHDPLTPAKMRHILEELRATSYSTVCPHGRPVMLKLTRREIEKNFQRI